MRPDSVSCLKGVSVSEMPQELDQFCQTEIDDFDVAVLGDHHVGGFEIAMDDAPVVSLRQAFGHFDREIRVRFNESRFSSMSCRSTGPQTSSIAMNVTPSTSSISCTIAT